MSVKVSSLPLLAALDSSAVIVVVQGGDSYRYPLSALLGQVAANSVTTTSIANDSITESKIADNSVSAQKLVDGSVENGKIAEGAVTLSKIGDLQVGTVKLADRATSAAKLAYDVLIGTHNYAVATGAANSYVVSNAVARTALIDGMLQVFKVSATNTGASTLNVDSLGVRPIVKNGGTALTAGDLIIGQIVSVRFDGNNWQKQ